MMRTLSAVIIVAASFGAQAAGAVCITAGKGHIMCGRVVHEPKRGGAHEVHRAKPASGPRAERLRSEPRAEAMARTLPEQQPDPRSPPEIPETGRRLVYRPGADVRGVQPPFAPREAAIRRPASIAAYPAAQPYLEDVRQPAR